MAKAASYTTSSSTAVTVAPTTRELSFLFAGSLTDANSSLIRQLLECLRKFSKDATDDETNIFEAFKYLKDKTHRDAETDDGTSLVSLITVTLIIPCYRFYSTHDKFPPYFFELLDLILVHPSVANNENIRFSIAVFISRTNLYQPKSTITEIDKWTIEMWLGKPISQSSIVNKICFESEKPFPFSPDSQICNILCDNTKYPIDITHQFDLFIKRAKNRQDTNADELTTLANILSQLFHCEFILQSFLNANQCLSSILSLAAQRQRISAVKLTDETNKQAQTQLASIKNQMLNQDECRVPRPSFLLPISKLVKYAYVQQQDDSDTDAKALWNLLLQTIYETFTKYLQNSASNLYDIKDFFMHFLTNEDAQIRETGTKLVITFMKSFPISADANLPLLLSCSMINDDNYSINEIVFNECLSSSLNWSIDELCSLLTTLCMKLNEISALPTETLNHHHIWFQFFVNLINSNLDRLILSSTKINENFIEFCQQIQTSLFIRLIRSSIENSFPILKFIIKYCEKDWIQILLGIIEAGRIQENIHELLKDSRQSAFDNWHIPSSFNLLLSLIKSNTEKNPSLLFECLQLLQKSFDVQSNLKNIDISTIIQPIMNVIHLVFPTENKDQQFIWNSTFRREILSSTITIILYLIDHINIKILIITPIDLQRIIQSTILLSVDYRQMLRLFYFVLQSKQQHLIEYWFRQLLTLTLLTNDTLNEECTPINNEQSSFDLTPSTVMELVGIYTYELFELLHEKFDQVMNFISSSTFNFLLLYIQRSIPICIQCLLHKNARIRVSIVQLVGRALNMQTEDLIKLLQSLQNSDSENINATEITILNLVNDQQRSVTQMQSTPMYLLEREKKRLKSQIPFRMIKRSNFGILATHLKSLTHFDENPKDDTTNLDALRSLISPCADEFSHLIPNRRQLPSLVHTKTMLNNRQRIFECIRTPIHLLLQGETGVGKSSLILDVAADLQKALIRFNLSSKTDIAGLFGSLKLKIVKSTNEQQIELDYEEGPFTSAYRHGHWLLLDEMNLASPNVLQAIEQALESGVLTIPNIEDNDTLVEQQNCRVYQIHPEFRLFATQNPSTGRYKGARDAQSTALLNRFSIFIVKGPENNELEDIVKNKLKNDKFPFLTQATQMVNLHLKIMEIIKDNDFKERNRNYAELTVRELFRWCQSLCDYEKMLIKASQTVSELDSHTFNQMITEQAYVIYGLRFRKPQSRSKIGRNIQNLFRLNPLPSTKLSIEYRSNNAVAFLSGQRLLLQMPIISLERVLIDWPLHIPKTNNNQELIRMIKIHNYVFKCFHNLEINQIYDCSYALFWSMIERRYSLDTSPLTEIIVEIYTSLSRNEKQRMEIVKYIATEFGESESILSQYSSSLLFARSSFYLDNEANRIAQFILAASPSQPILIVGPEGCGKSHLVQAIATLTNVCCQHLYLTPQTEPAALVGSLVPHPKLPQWHDGAVSDPITKGHWLILENFSEASSAVLERLNPVLEQPPQWVKVENNEFEPIQVHPNFRIIATMSPSTGRLQNVSIETNHELSPALYNRFLIIYYQGLNFSSLDVYKNMFTSYFPSNEKQIINSLCEQLQAERLTSRQLVQFIDCAFKLQHSNVTEKLRLDLPSILLSAYELVFNNDSITTSISPVKSYLEKQAKHGSINFFDLSLPQNIREEHREHIIDSVSTPTRYDAAKRLCAAIICARPVLLEGPAATGKTSLVEYLAQCSNKILYRVNNTKGTTIQDYFGSYMPNGEFLYGALSRAMSDGDWFVADEFDLAEPAVMNVLYPILEGQQYLIVPNTGQTLTARDGFRFFATQNGTSYIGRKQLPKTLRSRFLEIPFQSFTEKELEFIIIQRKSTSTISKSSATFDDDLKKVASQIASTVTTFNRYVDEKQLPLLGAPKLGLTMREVIKWINRKQRKSNVDWDEHALRLLESRVPKKLNDDFIICLKSSFPQLFNPPCHVKIEGNQISLCRPPRLPISYSFVDPKAAIDLQLSAAPEGLLLSLWRVFAAAEQHEPILLLGPTCYKSELIKIWSKLMAKESDLRIITCSSSTETNDLIGSIRPYTHADALSLLLGCLNQLCERAKKNLLQKTSSTDLKKLDAFCGYCNTFANDIDGFVNKIKEQQQEKKKVRKNRITKPIEYTSESIDASKTLKVETDLKHFPQIGLLSKALVTDQLITNDDDGEYFEKVYNTKKIINMMKNDSYIKDETDPFTTTTNDDRNEVYPFSTASVVATKSDEQNEIDPYPIGQPPQLSNDEKLLEFFIGTERDEQPTAQLFTSSSINQTNPVLEAFQIVKSKLEIIGDSLDDICRIASNENGVLLLKARCESIIIEINRAIEQGKSNIFLFQDGPVTSAVKEGKILVLEDINEPSQAVIERLNSLFELEPSFILYEDFTSQVSKTTHINPQRAKCPISPTFQVFATVHTDEKTENRLQLSAATRSRMTEIRIQPYQNHDLKQLAIKSMLNSLMDKDILKQLNKIIDIFADDLAPELSQAMKIDSLDSRHFVRFGQCLRLHLEHMPIDQAAAICVKFLFLDSIIEPKTSTISNISLSNTIWQKVLSAFKCEEYSRPPM